MLDKLSSPSSLYCLVRNSCIGVLLEELEEVTGASQNSELRILNSNLTERNFLSATLAPDGPDIKKVYYCRVVTLVISLSPAYQAYQ